MAYLTSNFFTRFDPNILIGKLKPKQNGHSLRISTLQRIRNCRCIWAI